MKRSGLFLLLIAAIISRAAADKILVVVDDPLIRNTHSQYFSDLIGRGHDVAIRSAGDKKLQLKDWDEWLYDKLVLFAPRADGFGGDLGASAVLEFVDAGNDVVIAADTQASDFIRNLVADIGVDLELRGTAVTDHVNFAKSSVADHTLILSDKFVKSDAILGNFTQQAPVLFKGIAATISPHSTLGLFILGAPDTAFSHVPGKPVTDHPLVANGHAALVSAIQARSGARVLVSGSLDMLSNAFFSSAVETSSGKRYPQSGNRLFCDEITKWAFHERGVLRVTNLRHNHAGSAEQPHWYRVSDDLELKMDIHELAGGTRQPYRAADVQVEFVMLDPYVRLNLQHDDQGHFFTAFRVPDVYGIYKFVVSYHKTGFNPLDLSKTVSVRPFRHNEFERFLTAAYPYYISVFSTMAAFFLFGIVFLYHK